jgi:hypothetical protein
MGGVDPAFDGRIGTEEEMEEGLLPAVSDICKRGDPRSPDDANPGAAPSPHCQFPTIRPTISAILGRETFNSVDGAKTY